MDVPFHTDIRFLAQRCRGLLRDPHEAKAQARRLPLRRRPASRDQSLPRSAQSAAQTLHMDRRSRQNHRRRQARAPSVRFDPLEERPIILWIEDANRSHIITHSSLWISRSITVPARKRPIYASGRRDEIQSNQPPLNTAEKCRSGRVGGPRCVSEDSTACGTKEIKVDPGVQTDSLYVETSTAALRRQRLFLSLHVEIEQQAVLLIHVREIGLREMVNVGVLGLSPVPPGDVLKSQVAEEFAQRLFIIRRAVINKAVSAVGNSTVKRSQKLIERDA